MEVIMFFLFPLVWATSSVYAVIGLLSLIIKKICKKDTKKTKRRLVVAIICSIVSLMVIGAYDTASDDVTNVADEIETTGATVETVETTTETSNFVNVGESKDNPFVLTAEELADEIMDDIDAAKEKYNDKWVMITGTITDTSDGGIMYGYYLYGQRSTTGYTGLRIMCWCDDGPYSGSVIGDTQTFIGILREVTTVNVTEIAECERISE